MMDVFDEDANLLGTLAVSPPLYGDIVIPVCNRGAVGQLVLKVQTIVTGDWRRYSALRANRQDIKTLRRCHSFQPAPA